MLRDMLVPNKHDREKKAQSNGVAWESELLQKAFYAVSKLTQCASSPPVKYISDNHATCAVLFTLG